MAPLRPLTLAVSLLAAVAPPAAGDDVALAALVSGPCRTRRTATEQASPVGLLDRFPSGAVVETGDAARLVVVYLTGERFELGPSSSAAVGPAALEARSGAVRRLAPVPSRVALAPLSAGVDASRRAGAVRVRTAEGLPMYPSAGAAVTTAEAVLRFVAVPGAERYSVAVEDEAGNTVFSAQTGATRVVLPKDVLREGAVYFWRVRARGPGLLGTGREERFATLPADDARRWEEARAALSAGDESLRALLGATASSLGLRREACLAARPPGGAPDEALASRLGCDALAPFLAGDEAR